MSIIASVMILLGILIRHFTLAKLSKKTFVFIWMLAMVRLLIPFELPFGFNPFDRVDNLMLQINQTDHSFDFNLLDNTQNPQIANSFEHIYQPINQHLPLTSPRSAIGRSFNVNLLEQVTPNLAESVVTPVLNPVDLLVGIWVIGMVIFTLHFTINYIKFRRMISDSLPLENEFIRQFTTKYQPTLRRKIQIRQSQKITSPLTYGMVNPVILIPKTLDWNDYEQLEYIFAHEYIHIKRFDCLIKTIATLVLCIHWLNPLIWVMYILLHRDIELSCDERVLELFGEQAKSTYALALIDLAEKQSNLITAHSYFSKHVGIKERIKVMATMKINKKSAIGAALAVLLVGGTMIASAASNNEVPDANEDSGYPVYTEIAADSFPDWSLDPYDFAGSGSLTFHFHRADFEGLTRSEMEYKIRNNWLSQNGMTESFIDDAVDLVINSFYYGDSVYFTMSTLASTLTVDLGFDDDDLDYFLNIYNSWDRILMSLDDMHFTLVDWNYKFTIMPNQLSIEEAGEIMAVIAYEEYDINLDGAYFEMSFFDYSQVDLNEVDAHLQGNVFWSVDILPALGNQLNLIIDGITGEVIFAHQY